VNRDELLKEMYESTLVGNAPVVLDLTRAGLAMGLEPETLLFDALIPARGGGARFERGDFFVPEMLIAGRAMAGALDLLRPLLAETGVEPVGTFVMGTVKVTCTISARTREHHARGRRVPGLRPRRPGRPREVHRGHPGTQARHRRLLGLPHTTMPMFKANMNALEKAGLREQVIVMVAARPSPGVRGRRGADGYASDASPR